MAGLLIIEAAAVTVNRLGLEEAVKRAGVDGVDGVVDRDDVAVTGTRPATVLVSDRVAALSHLVVPTATAEGSIPP